MNIDRLVTAMVENSNELKETFKTHDIVNTDGKVVNSVYKEEGSGKIALRVTSLLDKMKSELTPLQQDKVFSDGNVADRVSKLIVEEMLNTETFDYLMALNKKIKSGEAQDLELIKKAVNIVQENYMLLREEGEFGEFLNNQTFQYLTSLLR